MDSVKYDPSLPGESSFNKMNPKDVFQVPKSLDTVESNSPKHPIDDLPWIVDGLAFPKGTEFRGQYKGHVYYGKVNSGALMMNGKEFLSPCAAATAITRNSVDGWLFWDCKPPGASSWTHIYNLKQMK